MIPAPLAQGQRSRLEHISVLDVKQRVVHIYRAKRWRKIDERMGEGYARRQRTRNRLARRPPWKFVPNAEPEPPKRTIPKSHKGYGPGGAA